MAYFTKDTFQFLRELRSNNHKEWLDENRQCYKEHRAKLINFAGSLYDAFATVETMPLQDPKKSVARINNNRKFHPDKPPYKHNFAVMINRGEGQCGFYIHLEPGNCFVGGGIYHPPREKLDAVRAEIANTGNELEQVTQNADFQKYFGQLEGRELKTAPRDYPKDHPYIHLLRKKDFVVHYPFRQSDFLKKSIVEDIREVYKAAVPFLNYLDRGLEVSG